MEQKELFNELTRRNISQLAWDYIFNNFKKVETDDYKGRVWTSVSRIDNDEKYGRIMICLDTKEWRNDNFSEFYGGPGVYDYTGEAGGKWHNHRNHPSLQKYIIPKEGEKFDFAPHNIDLGVVD